MVPPEEQVPSDVVHLRVGAVVPADVRIHCSDGLTIGLNMKPRIFLGSSGKQAKLVQAMTRGLAEVADVEPWTTVSHPGVATLDRLVELSQEVDFAAFVFAQDDWTTNPSDATAQGQA